jgi:hypothetical protein
MNNNKLTFIAWTSMISLILIIMIACGLDGPMEPGILSNILLVMLVCSMLGVVIPLILTRNK